MRRAPLRLQQGRGNGGAVLLASLAGFAVICGLVILVIGSGPGREEVKAGPSPVKLGQIKRQVSMALQSMNAAEGALSAANYGALRGHLLRGRESLAVVQYQIKQAQKASASQDGPKSKKK